MMYTYEQRRHVAVVSIRICNLYSVHFGHSEKIYGTQDLLLLVYFVIKLTKKGIIFTIGIRWDQK